MLNELGLNVSLADMFERFVGLSMPQCVELITRMLGAPPPDDFVPILRQRAADALRSEVVPVAGVPEVLEELWIPCCVASSGDHEKIRLTLGATGLLARFENRIFSVTDVGKPKPAPDVFLFAARKLGVEPSACAVIEDTPTGIRAAVSAGMHAFGFAANTPAHRLRDAGAHHVFSEMRQLPELLQLNGVMRQARREDIPAMHRVRMSVRENKLVSTIIHEADYLEAIEVTGRGWVIELDGQIVAFAVGNARTGNIWALFVHPDHERRGYGQQIFDVMVNWLWSSGLQKIWLTTEPGTRAQRFYEAAGWEYVGRTERGELRFERNKP